ncbi:MAG: ribonuclease III [Parcubacteria group bacterium Gr01-1014_19]|nr:MAG: ribonuclease III [Parcubacteria group bacterium Gr01-1014_19]
MATALISLEKKIEYSFKEKDLLKEALTHRSYLNENPDWKLPDNERLEFLGDAVLELTTTEELFKRFPDHKEGALTSYRAALVNYIMMARVAVEIGLDKFVLLSKGEAKDAGKAREVILANAMEALIGAIYLDSGYDSAKKFVVNFVIDHLDEVLKSGSYKDPKSTLQEKAQEKMKITPSYQVMSETGPDHAKVFVVGVYFGEKLIAKGSGHSKQEAEAEAAREALTSL